MATTHSSLDTMHEDMIHDAQLNYYGNKLATCSSDRTIKVFEVSADSSSHTQLAEIKGHEGPVWQVAWAHPKFGSVLASCSYDRKVIIWKEAANNVWNKIYEYDKHESSVNSIAWAPHEFGLILACASSDCTISILTYRSEHNVWDAVKIQQAHSIGVNSVSWAPAGTLMFGREISNEGAVSTASLISAAPPTTPPVKRFVSGGSDNTVKIWRFSDTENQWKCEETLDNHTDWVRDVAWAPNIGLPSSTIASCSQDGTVTIWSQENSLSPWTKKVLPKFPDVVWRVSWSVTGNILAVSGGDNKVTLWKESLDGEWKCISQLEDEDAQ